MEQILKERKTSLSQQWQSFENISVMKDKLGNIKNASLSVYFNLSSFYTYIYICIYLYVCLHLYL